MCCIANLFDTNIRELDAKKTYFLPWMLRQCQSLEKCNFLFKKIWCAWGWTLAENQKHWISGSQNYLLLTRKVQQQFFNQWILLYSLGKAKESSNLSQSWLPFHLEVSLTRAKRAKFNWAGEVWRRSSEVVEKAIEITIQSMQIWNSAALLVLIML